MICSTLVIVAYYIYGGFYFYLCLSSNLSLLLTYWFVCFEMWSTEKILLTVNNLLENPSGSNKEEDSDTRKFLVYQTQRYLFSYYETVLSSKSSFIMMMQQPVRTWLHDK